MDFKHFLIILSFAFLPACIGSDGDEPEEETASNSNASELNLSGTSWLFSCHFVANSDPNDPGLSTYQESTLTFSNTEDTFTITVDIYESDNSSCSGAPFLSPTATYTSTIGESVSTNSLTAYEWDAVLIEETPADLWPEVSFSIIYRDGDTLYISEEAEDELFRPNELSLDDPWVLIL